MEAWTFTGGKYRDVAGCVGMRSRRPMPKGTGFGKESKEQERLLQVCNHEKERPRACAPLVSHTGRLLAADKEKVKVLNNFLPQSSLPALFTLYSNG